MENVADYPSKYDIGAAPGRPEVGDFRGGTPGDGLRFSLPEFRHSFGTGTFCSFGSLPGGTFPFLHAYH